MYNIYTLYIQYMYIQQYVWSPEPLYQYINTAEFLRTPQENVKPGLTKNQLDIARQLSSRRLWCEQPEVHCSIQCTMYMYMCIYMYYIRQRSIFYQSQSIHDMHFLDRSASLVHIMYNIHAQCMYLHTCICTCYTYMYMYTLYVYVYIVCIAANDFLLVLIDLHPLSILDPVW